MPDHSLPPAPLTTASRRAEVASMLSHRVVFPIHPTFVVELLDALNGAVLRTAGLTDPAALSVLAAMWRER